MSKKKQKTGNNKQEKTKELPVAKKIKEKISFKQQLSYISLSFTLITGILLFILTVLNSSNLIEQTKLIVSIAILVLFSLAFVFTGLSADNKKGQVFTTIGSVLLTSYFVLNILDFTGIFQLPTQDYLPDFTSVNIIEVMNWAEARNIKINQEYEDSDFFEEYTIIKQDVDADTLVKDVEELNILVSSGPDENKSVLFPLFIGKNVDDVIEYVEANFYTNVNIDFIVSTQPKDIVLEQNKSGMLSRNEKINIIVSIGNEDEIVPMKMLDFTGKSKFYAATWLKRYGFKYKLEAVYNKEVKLDYVVSQNVEKNILADPLNTNVELTISKGNKIIVPDLTNMSLAEINSWIVKNRLTIEFKDSYDEKIKEGNIISANYKKDDEVEQGTLIIITISKGVIKVPSFELASQYITWAEDFGINIKEEFAFNEDIAKGNIVKLSHAVGSVLKNNEEFVLTVSNGKAITVPSLVNKTKAEIQKICSQNNIKCSFTDAYSNNVASGRSIKQSVRSGSKISTDAIVRITMSIGKKPTAPVCDKNETVLATKRFPGKTVSESKQILNEAYPGIKFSFKTGSPGYGVTGHFYGSLWDKMEAGIYLNYCDTYTIYIIQN